MQWRWPLGLVGVAVAASMVVSFGLNSAAAAASSAGPSKITLLEGVQNQPNFWFPNMPAQYCTTTNQQMYGMAFRPLVWIDNQDTISYPQSIATGITVNSSDTVFTVHVGTKFKWSNGQTVNAYDALYDAQLLMATAQKNAPWTDCGVGIGGLPSDWKSVTAPNATTLVFTTTVPVNPTWFEENGIGQVYPIEKTLWDKSSNWTTELKYILKEGTTSTAAPFRVVDGPYAYGPFANDAYATLVANPKYTGPAPAHIKTISFLYETSDANLWAAALRRTFSEVGIPGEYDSQRETLVKQAGYKLGYAQYGFCFFYALPNLNPQDPMAPFLSLRYVRQALELGMDQTAMIKLAGGIGVTDYGPVPSDPRTIYYDPQVNKYGYAYNPARGKRILEAHGWRMKNGVMTNSKGQQLVFKVLFDTSGGQVAVEWAELWQAKLRLEGIKINLEPEEFNQLVAQTDQTHTWEISWIGGWCYEPDYYPTAYGLLGPGAASNTGDFSDPEMTKLILATHAPGTPAQTLAAFDKYELFAAEDLPYFYTPNTGGYTATQPWLHTPYSAYDPVQAITQFNMWYTTADK